MNNPQAFPSHGSRGEVAQEGMMLRDYFAAKAMQGWVSSWPVTYERLVSIDHVGSLAEQAYMVADAMLAERLK